MVVAMKAPLPSPRKMTASGSKQQSDAAKAAIRLTSAGLNSRTCITLPPSLLCTAGEFPRVLETRNRRNIERLGLSPQLDHTPRVTNGSRPRHERHGKRVTAAWVPGCNRRFLSESHDREKEHRKKSTPCTQVQGQGELDHFLGRE